MLDHDNQENYRNPVLHDLESDPFQAEGSWLLQLARMAAGPVLELGCGTGRVTIPLAQQGIDITGMEVVEPMLNHARRKTGDIPIRWVQADMRDFQLARRYPLIFARGGVFEHLLTRPDQEAMLQNVGAHLAEEGRFVLDVGCRPPASLVDSVEAEWFSYVDPQGCTVQVSGYDRFDHWQQLWHQAYYRRWQTADGQAMTEQVQLTLRYLLPQEMEALLHYNGFRILARYADWDGNPVAKEVDGMVYVCGKR